jgi:hypothetical protein
MEQPIWLFFGVIAVLIALGIIAHLVLVQGQDSKAASLENSMVKLRQQCDFVCGTTLNNRLSIRAEFPAGLYLHTQDNKICSGYKETVKCVACSCMIEPYQLALNTTLAQEIDSHSYNCFFERKQEGVSMECLG